MRVLDNLRQKYKSFFPSVNAEIYIGKLLTGNLLESGSFQDLYLRNTMQEEFKVVCQKNSGKT